MNHESWIMNHESWIMNHDIKYEIWNNWDKMKFYKKNWYIYTGDLNNTFSLQCLRRRRRRRRRRCVILRVRRRLMQEATRGVWTLLPMLAYAKHSRCRPLKGARFCTSFAFAATFAMCSSTTTSFVKEIGFWVSVRSAPAPTTKPSRRAAAAHHN